MELTHLREGWKSASMVCGVLFAMLTGQKLNLVFSATSLDIYHSVSEQGLYTDSYNTQHHVSLLHGFSLEVLVTCLCGVEIFI